MQQWGHFRAAGSLGADSLRVIEALADCEPPRITLLRSAEKSLVALPSAFTVRLASCFASDVQDAIETAGSAMPEALRSAIEQRMAGEPLSEAEEVAQIGQHWRGQAPAGNRP